MGKKITMDELVGFLKNQGYVYQGSEIYGGLANAWDYGPLGVELLNNIKKMWWKKFVQESKTNVGLDAAILMNPRMKVSRLFHLLRRNPDFQGLFFQILIQSLF